MKNLKIPESNQLQCIQREATAPWIWTLKWMSSIQQEHKEKPLQQNFTQGLIKVGGVFKGDVLIASDCQDIAFCISMYILKREW